MFLNDSSCGSSFYAGIVWKVSKKGAETVLHHFSGGPSDGAAPYAGVILDKNGNLYGDTAAGGGVGLCDRFKGCGTVYKLSRAARLTLLHRFTGSDGSSPFGGVLPDAKGNLYGTAGAGGSGQGCTYGCGTVWKLTP
jgi:uncharacterized repeat protein (TIGR03803 family)